jgi:hypothetical protein
MVCMAGLLLPSASMQAAIATPHSKPCEQPAQVKMVAIQ